MFTRLRHLAAIVLMLAALPAQSASGWVVMHLAGDHAAPSEHDAHHTEQHSVEHEAHHAEAPAADAQADPRGAHDRDHSHDLVSAHATPVARTLGPDTILQVVLPAWLDQAPIAPAPAAHVRACFAPAAGPPGSQRHFILLI